MRKALRPLFIALLGFAFCTSALAQEKPRVVAVNYALQYMAERLLGEAGEVLFPVPEGVDPSFWRPSISDISTIQSADLILLNGAGFATWVDRVSLPRSRLVNTSAALSDRYIVTESITHSHGEGGEHSHEGLAAYLWLDPALAIGQAEAVAAALAARELAPPDEIYGRFAELRADLEALDGEIRAALSAAQGITFVATHPRYQYFARAYGVEIASLEWEAGAAPGTEDLADLQALVAEGKALLIWEAAPPEEGAEAVARLGLQSVLFEPLARTPSEGDFLESLKATAAAFSEAIAGASVN